MGEYGRALAMAKAIMARWPAAEIHFVLSREAPYAAATPFPATFLPSSPTFHSPEVVALIHQLRPGVVIFDNAGRTAQLRAARGSGARVVFVSARPQRRRKAFRLHWMRLIDEHWVAYPRWAAGELGFIERLKLRLLGRPRLRFLDPVLPPSNATLAQSVLDRFGMPPHEYVAVIPGGGTEHAGMAAAFQSLSDAARRTAARGIPTLLVGLEPERAAGGERLRSVGRLPIDELAEVLRNARVVVTNGGYTLLQALASDCACVAVALAKDQSERIDRVVAVGLAQRGEPEGAALEQQVLSLMSDGPMREALQSARKACGIASGVTTVVSAISELTGK